MKLAHIVVATDASDVSRAAYITALDLAKRASATVSVMRTVTGRAIPVGAFRDSSTRQVDELARWARESSELLTIGVESHIEFGHPSIEIPRHAETAMADLIVLGRKPRTRAMRSHQGDVADEVMRRSTLPCLLVPPHAAPIHRVLVAVHASVRGWRVITEARDVTNAIGATLRAITVEPGVEHPQAISQAGTLKLRAELGDILTVRHGVVFDQVLAEVHETSPDLLIIGVERGGPPATLQRGSVSRQLAHAAPCPVLTIPT